MKAVAFIFARGGSKGLPGKNILPLGGKPLIAWSIEHARAIERIERVIVSTDSQDIADVARAHGAEVPLYGPQNLLATLVQNGWHGDTHLTIYIKQVVHYQRRWFQSLQQHP